MDAPATRPFDSLAAMRAEYGALSDQIGKDILAPANLERVREFIRRGAATGAALDAAKDRTTAQGLINFWVARLSAASRTAGGPDAAPPFEETLLADFDEATVKQVADDAEAWFSALPPDRQENARRALMRMVVLPAEGKAFASSPVSRASLDSYGPPERIDAGLARLEEMNLLRVTPGDSPGAALIALRHDALMREWPRMAGWLERRMRFRQAAYYWEANGRAPAALIRDELLDEAREYHDRDDLEKQFIAASATRARQQDRAARHLRRWESWGYYGLVGLLALFAIAACIALYQLSKAREAEKARADAEKARADVVRLQKEGLIANGLADSISTSLLIELLTKEDAHYAKKLLIIQTLGQMISAASDEAWGVAAANWRTLEQDLKDDPAPNDTRWFATEFFPGKVDGGGDRTNQGRIDRLKGSWADSREHRTELFWVSKYLRQWLRSRIDGGVKKRWYEVAQRTMDGLSEAARDGRTLSDAAAFHGLFWRLRLGEMVLVRKSHAVENAMATFGNRLEEWECLPGNSKAPDGLAEAMQAVANDLRTACERDVD